MKSCVVETIEYVYGYYNDKRDIQYYKEMYMKKGYENIKVKRIRSDTRGLRMYEILGSRKEIKK